MQTGKLERRPILLVGHAFWEGLYQWLRDEVESGAFIDREDLEFLEIVADADAAAETLLDYYCHQCPED